MLDRSKCKKMLVWRSSESEAVERIVIEILTDGSCLAVDDIYTKSFHEEGSSYGTVVKWKHCKTIPEEKPVTILDVMYKANLADVMKYKGCDWFYPVLTLQSDSPKIEEMLFNILIKENGEVKLKHETWLTAEQYVRGE